MTDLSAKYHWGLYRDWKSTPIAMLTIGTQHAHDEQATRDKIPYK